jgi:hypothetical protein
MMKQWSGDVLLCTDGSTTFSPEMQSRLEQHGVAIRPENIARLEGDNEGHLQAHLLHRRAGLGEDRDVFHNGLLLALRPVGTAGLQTR